MTSSSLIVGPLVLACVLLLITFHPQPIDPCPCFEDTVAIVSVVQGCLLSHWALGFVGSNWVPASGYQLDYTSPAGVGLCAAKVVIGLCCSIIFEQRLTKTYRNLRPYSMASGGQADFASHSAFLDPYQQTLFGLTAALLRAVQVGYSTTFTGSRS